MTAQHAIEFAATPAGYITGVAVPVLASWALWATGRILRRLGGLEKAQTVQTQALAVLVKQVDDDRPVVLTIPDLRTSVAVLQDRLDRHEQWAQNEHRQLRDAAALRAPQNPGGTP